MGSLRLRAALLLAALAFLLASQSAHAHASGPSLEVACGVCITASQARSIAVAPALPMLGGPQAPALDVGRVTPGLQEARPATGAPPRGPPTGA